ncbi:MAG: sigma-70 family RNA polymerase sigma factor [Planctomycetes bacterium]|nr:sigma-70 family RNA polymerase sigma factor [Planctomycetota bacterium]
MSERNHTETEGDFLSHVLRTHSLSEADVSRLLAAPPVLRDFFVAKAQFILRSHPSLEDLSEDVAQDLFHELKKIISRFQGRSTLKTYLIGVVGNKCRTRIQAAKREKQWPDRDPKTGEIKRFDPPSASRGPLQQLLEKEADPVRRRLVTSIRESIPQLLEELSQQEKRVLELRYGDSENAVDWDRIAHVLNITSDAAKRTRDRLRRKIERRWLPGLLRPVLNEFPNDGIDARILLCRVCQRRSCEQTAEQLRIDRKEVVRRMRAITDLFMRFVALESSASSRAPRTTHQSTGKQS